uniref:NAD kinase n=1 Tax=Candidatus Aschnera chinzeii TaxID=1485666 RepID=A0AAT9G3U4_9ENTR|nr:MAG: NAD(+) kinase [Candidatus Aschnera chinzeii]
MLTSKTAQKNNFQIIGIIGSYKSQDILKTHKKLYQWLINHNYTVIIENNIAQKLNLKNVYAEKVNKIGKLANLIIVIGGDGNMLNAARYISRYQKNIIGINHGNLGFLTDLQSHNALKQLSKIFLGEYLEEERLLLNIIINQENYKIRKSTAINEVILRSNKITQMIDFQVYIDDNFAFAQRSDGLIISTPTGSTAYSLSAGGPILSPSLTAITLIPMLPHTLSSRPLVIDGSSKIKIKLTQNNINCKISCDNHIHLTIHDKDEILIEKSNKKLKLIHPKDYNYFNLLNLKLNWLKKTF